MSASASPAWLQHASAVEAAGAGGMDFVRIGGALALCLVIGVAVILMLRKASGSRLSFMSDASPRRLRVVETTRLGAKVQLCLIECDGHAVLCAVHPQGVTSLHARIKAEPEPVV